MSNRPAAAVALDSFFGPLELRVLEAAWSHGEAVVVRDLLPSLGEVAYTTIMTTLDRLHRKGILGRERRGRAFAYTPLCTRDELASTLVGNALASLMPSDPRAIRPLMSTFLDEVGRRDASLLDELEEKIRRRREEIG